MPKPVINKEVLIKLVRKRPALWDKSLDIYKDRQLKIAAWREICEILMKDFDVLDENEKQQFCKFVIKIWTQTRDSWVRSLTTRKYSKHPGPIATVSRPYKYHKEMLFLKKVVSPAKPYDRVVDESGQNEEEEEISEGSKSETLEISDTDWPVDTIKEEVTEDAADSHETKRTKEIDDKMVVYYNNQIKDRSDTQQEDRHLAFFKSIQPTLTLLNDDQILDFQSGVISLLQNIKRNRNYNDWATCEPQTSNYVETRGYYTHPPQDSTPTVAVQPVVRQRMLYKPSSSAVSSTKPKLSRHVLDPLKDE